MDNIYDKINNMNSKLDLNNSDFVRFLRIYHNNQARPQISRTELANWYRQTYINYNIHQILEIIPNLDQNELHSPDQILDIILRIPDKRYSRIFRPYVLPPELETVFSGKTVVYREFLKSIHDIRLRDAYKKKIDQVIIEHIISTIQSFKIDDEYTINSNTIRFYEKYKSIMSADDMSFYEEFIKTEKFLNRIHDFISQFKMLLFSNLFYPNINTIAFAYMHHEEFFNDIVFNILANNQDIKIKINPKNQTIEVKKYLKILNIYNLTDNFYNAELNLRNIEIKIGGLLTFIQLDTEIFQIEIERLTELSTQLMDNQNYQEIIDELNNMINTIITILIKIDHQESILK